MKKDADELERYLSEFRPQAVKPLPFPQAAAKKRLRVLAVAALLLICVGAALWYVRDRENKGLTTVTLWDPLATVPPSARPSLLPLTRLALENDEQFQAQLSAESRQVLPPLRGAQSTLSVLAKE